MLDYQAFDRREPLTGVSDAWIAELEERLDPAYYEPHDSVPDIEGALDHATEATKGLAKAQVDAAQVQEWIPAFLESVEFKSVRLSEALTEIRDAVRLIDDDIYRLLGVRWHGEGTFIREERLGREIKANTLYRVTRGQLVYNRLFAWQGSFAVVADEHHGAYASNEFPMLEAKPGEYDGPLLLRYIAHFMNSPRTLTFVDAASTGSTTTSRNRFMQETFLRRQVDVPRESGDLSRIVQIMDAALDLSMRTRALASDARILHEHVGSLLPVIRR